MCGPTQKRWLQLPVPAAPPGLAGSAASLSASLICLEAPQAQTQTQALKNRPAPADRDLSATRDAYKTYCGLFSCEEDQ